MESIHTHASGIGGMLERAVQVTRKITSFYIMLLLIGMGLMLGMNIVLRYFFGHSFPWADLLGRYAYIHIVLLGTAISYIEGSHAQIVVLYERVTGKTRIRFDVIHYAVMLFLCLVLTVVGCKHVVTTWAVHPPILAGVPLGAVYLAVPLSALVIILYLLQLIVALKYRRGF
jgi:TRAP-type C4-dicarboxylate transport system permease small subunit